MRASEEAGLSWAEGVPAPKDANGDVVTVDAETVTIDSPVELFRQYARMDGEDE